MSFPVVPKDITFVILHYLRLVDLQQWREVSKRSQLLCDQFWVSHSRQLVSNYWNRQIEDGWTSHLVSLFREFQDNTDAIITGSNVLQYFSGKSFTSRDLDLFLIGTPTSFSAFLTLIHKLIENQEGWLIWAIKQNDQLPEVDETDFARMARSFSKWSGPILQSDRNHAAYLQRAEPESKIVSRSVHEGSFQKHLPSICFKIYLVASQSASICSCVKEAEPCVAMHRSFDVVFILPQNAPQGIYQYIRTHFDLDICVSAVTRKRLLCMMPQSIRHNRGTLCFDQYCVGPEEAGVISLPEWYGRWSKHRKDYVDIPCICTTIIMTRVEKYQQRGFTLFASLIDRNII